MREHIQFTLGKTEPSSQSYYFKVKAQSRYLAIAFSIPLPYALLVYVILRDSNGSIRLQKQIGYGEQVLCLGPDGKTTTNGGVPGPIEAGDWTLETMVFSEYVHQKMGNEVISYEAVISDEALPITECIGEIVWADCGMEYTGYNWNHCKKSGAAWYKGDFHTHTRVSDGKESVASATEKAALTELQFYTATEHNVIHTGWVETDLLVIPGVEVTTEQGHCNLLGITRMPHALPDVLANMGQESVTKEMVKVIEEAKELGWMFSMNHPFLSIWSWKYKELPLQELDCIEIINDPTYPLAAEANDRAIRFLDLLFDDGYQIAGIGGSDSHNLLGEYYEGGVTDSIAGDPGTYIYAENLSAAGILQGLRQRNCIVTRFCKAESEITVDGQAVLPGVHIPFYGEAEVVYTIRLLGIEEAPVCFGYHNGIRQELAVKQLGKNQYEVTMKKELEGGAYHWMRVEARTKANEILAYVNPVFMGSRTHTLRTFGEAAEKMGS